jgi:hypothetical protein
MTTIDKAIADALTARYQAGEPGAAEVIVVRPEKDSPLETLLCLYEKRKGDYDAAREAWSEYKSALTAALRDYEPDENVSEYEVPAAVMWPAITVSWRSGREYLPTDLIKQHIPQVWKAFKQTTKGYWDVRKKGKR